jgi:hypothetical protein
MGLSWMRESNGHRAISLRTTYDFFCNASSGKAPGLDIAKNAYDTSEPEKINQYPLSYEDKGSGYRYRRPIRAR